MTASPFLRTVEATAAALNACGGEWMLFGGAAMVLLGFDDAPVSDIDIIAESGLAARLMAGHGLENQADTASERFRSDVVLRPTFGAVPVEILSGFRIRHGDGWQAVPVCSAQSAQIGAERVPLPPPARLAQIFTLCGRPKDLVRAARLRAATG